MYELDYGIQTFGNGNSVILAKTEDEAREFLRQEEIAVMEGDEELEPVADTANFYLPGLSDEELNQLAARMSERDHGYPERRQKLARAYQRGEVYAW